MIIKINFFFLFIFSFACCQCQVNNENISVKKEVYVIKHIDKNNSIDSITGDTILFSIEFYFDYNIILVDTIPDIYYHKKRFYCLTGSEFGNKLPYFRNIQPEHFQKNTNITDILNQILSDTIRPKRLYIAYNHDTILDERYFQMKKSIIKNNIAVSTRNLTEEEEVIISSIHNKRKYKPEDINWQRTLYVPGDKLLKNRKLKLKNVP